MARILGPYRDNRTHWDVVGDMLEWALWVTPTAPYTEGGGGGGGVGGHVLI